jgi:hypothetical protein
MDYSQPSIFTATLRRILICAPQLGFCIVHFLPSACFCQFWSSFRPSRVHILDSLWLISQNRIGRAAGFRSPLLNVSQLVGVKRQFPERRKILDRQAQTQCLILQTKNGVHLSFREWHNESQDTDMGVRNALGSLSPSLAAQSLPEFYKIPESG